MDVDICVVDAFTNSPFRGNPAAVCFLPAWREDDWLQSVASEMNLSETAFLVLRDDGAYDLRWFTPTTEVDLCGHATLASAHAIRELRGAGAGQDIRFHSRSGWLCAKCGRDEIVLDFPATVLEEVTPPDGLFAALGARSTKVYGNAVWLMVVLDGEASVRALTPNFSALLALPCSALIVTAESESEGVDVVSRCFVPWVGIDEDPVTGAAHCCLAPYWSKVLGKEAMTAYQASRRGGVLRIRSAVDRVFLGGDAVMVWRGTLMV